MTSSNALTINTKINTNAHNQLTKQLDRGTNSTLTTDVYLKLSKRAYARYGVKLALNKFISINLNKGEVNTNYWRLTKGNNALTLSSSQLTNPNMIVQAVKILNK